MSEPHPSEPIASATLRAVLKSQYDASLATLRETIERCPDDLWFDDRPTNAYWSKLEHQLVNIRHIQHHAAQLADRLRTAVGIGIRWVDAGTPTP